MDSKMVEDALCACRDALYHEFPKLDPTVLEDVLRNARARALGRIQKEPNTSAECMCPEWIQRLAFADARCREYQPTLLEYIRRRFPTLTAELQKKTVETTREKSTELVAEEPHFEPDADWGKWLEGLAFRECLFRAYQQPLLDYIRKEFPGVRSYEDRKKLVQRTLQQAEPELIRTSDIGRLPRLHGLVADSAKSFIDRLQAGKREAEEALAECRNVLQGRLPGLDQTGFDEVLQATKTRAVGRLNRQPDFSPRVGWKLWFAIVVLAGAECRRLRQRLLEELERVFPTATIDLGDVVKDTVAEAMKNVEERLEEQVGDHLENVREESLVTRALRIALARGYQESLCRFLRRKFRNKRDYHDDWIQSTLQKEAERLQTQPDCKVEGWKGWLRTRVYRVAIDDLRKKKNVIPLAVTSTDNHGPSCREPEAPGGTSSKIVAAPETKKQRLKLLSEVLREYCQYCDREGRERKREVFERALRGQKPSTIAEQMGLERQSVYDMKSMETEKVRKALKKKVPNTSFFLTVMFGKPKGEIRLPPQQMPTTSGQRSVDLLHVVVDEMGAMCPEDDQLAAYRERPDAENLRHLRYHVRDAQWQGDMPAASGAEEAGDCTDHEDTRPTLRGCPRCQATLDAMSAGDVFESPHE